jgi:acyl carrier protein
MGGPFPQVAVSMRELTLNPSIDSSPGLFPAKEPERPAAAHQRPELSTKYIEPEDPLEQTLAHIFQDFLGIKKVGIDDNFFELGISSLDLVQIGSKLKETLEKDIPVVTMFTYATVRTLARFLQQEQEKETGDIPEPEAEDLLQSTIDLLND